MNEENFTKLDNVHKLLSELTCEINSIMSDIKYIYEVAHYPEEFDEEFQTKVLDELEFQSGTIAAIINCFSENKD